MQQLAYLTDPLKCEFEAIIVKKIELAAGQFDLILEQTYFYPTGGGQLHDTGTVDQARVIDVFKAGDGQVVHRVDRAVTATTAPARIDWTRRLGHMQHHSAQHILSAALEQVLSLETLSVKISADSPATVDVPEVELSWSDLEQIEQLANNIVFENRVIKSYFISQEQLNTVSFRRPPQVSGQIRVVEVDSFDYSACGGTHCPQTGMIGLIKIIKSERKNKKLRLHFVAGQQALAHFRQYYGIVTEISRQLSTGPDDVVRQVELQSAQLSVVQREINSLRAEILGYEAEKLLGQAKPYGKLRLLTQLFQNRPLAELRELARLLQTQAKLVAVLAGYDGQKLAMVISCADDTGLNARELLAQQLALLGGKGGGTAQLAQGGGAATVAQVEQLLAAMPAYLQSHE